MQNKLLILLLAGLLQSALSSAQSRQPNLVLIFCDDMGYGDLACYGNPVIQTPNLDKMAFEGRKFTNFYATSPACTASRYSLMTGKYPVRSGFSWVLGPTSAKGIHPKERILPEALKEAGYATAIFGKWHLGTKKKQFLPLQNGFDVYYGLPYSNDMIPPRWGEIALMEGNDTLQMSPDQTLLTRNCTERAIRFMEAHRDQPFFIYLPFNMPHVPLNPGSQFAGSSPRGKYGDVVQEIDFCVGQLLEKIDQLGLDGNTLVLFTSDNGPWITQKQNAGSAGPLRDGKGSTWEGGMRVPAIARWPGKIPATSNESRPCATIDVYRSFCTLAGASPKEHACDGLDISGLLGGEQTAFPEERVFFYYGPGNQLQAVRKRRLETSYKNQFPTQPGLF
ncbi:MAG: sulfatase [Saprospiraceae bacterium]